MTPTPGQPLSEADVSLLQPMTSLEETAVNTTPEPTWQWYAGHDGETYSLGPEPTRDAILSVGRDDYGGDAFYIVEATKGTMQEYLPSATDVIEMMQERADNDGAFGDDYCEITGSVKAAEADLDQLLRDWYARHAAIFPTPWKFASSRNEEIIPAQGA